MITLEGTPPPVTFPPSAPNQKHTRTRKGCFTYSLVRRKYSTSVLSCQEPNDAAVHERSGGEFIRAWAAPP